MKKLRILGLSFALVGALGLVSAVSADAPNPNAFVCPVLGGEAGGSHGNSAPAPIVGIGQGDSSVIGPDVRVPIHATNQDGDGEPGPLPATLARPGDADYSPIWYTS